MTSVLSSAKRASNSNAMEAVARFGLGARAFVYLVIGWLAIEIALGHGSKEADQRGAFAEIAQHSFGAALLWALGSASPAYALWRLSEPGSARRRMGRMPGPGLSRWPGGSSTPSSLFQPSPSSPELPGKAGTATRDLDGAVDEARPGPLAGRSHRPDRGGGRNRDGDRRRPPQVRAGPGTTADEPTGASRGHRSREVGTIARGVVFAIAGALVLDAAITYDPAKSAGLDGALRTLADRAYGPWLSACSRSAPTVRRLRHRRGPLDQDLSDPVGVCGDRHDSADPAGRSSTMNRSGPARLAATLLAAGVLVMLAGTFAPWLRSGQVTRNSYRTAGLVAAAARPARRRRGRTRRDAATGAVVRRRRAAVHVRLPAHGADAVHRCWPSCWPRSRRRCSPRRPRPRSR